MKTNGKTFFLIPGFKDQIGNNQYKWLVTYLENKGIKVIKTPVDWNYKTLSQNATEFIEFFNVHKSRDNYVLGFSFGAVLALMVANLIRPKKIYLCSLSAAFSEDQSSTALEIKNYIGKKRFADMATRSGKRLARELSVPSVLFYGEKEGKEFPTLRKRCKETAVLAKNSKLILVKGSPHQIDFPEYVRMIKAALDL